VPLMSTAPSGPIQAAAGPSKVISFDAVTNPDEIALDLITLVS